VLETDTRSPFGTYRLAGVDRALYAIAQGFFEVDPLRCPQCGAEMRIVAFITARAVIDRILDHLRRARDTAREPPRRKPGPRLAPSRPTRQPA